MTHTQTTATIDGGKLSLDLYDLLGSLSGEARTNLIDTLSCCTEVIDEVINQVLDGYTTQGSYGPKGWGGNPHATHGIDGARMRIAKASSEVAAEEIKRLAEALEKAKAAQDVGWNAYRELLDQRRYG